MLELACFRAQPQHALALTRYAGPFVRALRAHFPGLRKVQLARVGDGRWLQVGFWDTREEAEAAAEEMFDLPEMYDWLAQVDEFAEAPSRTSTGPEASGPGACGRRSDTRRS